MTEIDLHHQPSLLEQKIMFAKYLARADMLPRAYRDKPANVLLAIEYGEALGVAPMTAINMVHVIEGKPSMSAGLMGALVRQAGHRIRVEYDPVNQIANAMLWRKDDPDFTFTSRWDMERARQAGLTSKDNWKHYGGPMLKARAITEVCRDGCPEVLAGIAYSSDELGARFLNDSDREDAGLMTIGDAVAHEQLAEVLPHDRQKTERVRPGDEDPQADLWASDSDSPPATAEDDNPLHRQPGEES